MMITVCLVIAIVGVLLGVWYGCRWYMQNREMKRLTAQMTYFLIYGKEPLAETLEEGTYANLHNEIAALENQCSYLQGRSAKREEEIIHFVENMTHQMNNAVTALQIQLDLLQLRENMEHTAPYEKSQNCLEQLKGDIDRILKASQLAEGKIRMVCEPLLLREELTDCIRRLHSLSEERQVDVELEPGEDLRFMADGFWLSQAFENVLKNAIEYSRAHSAVYVRLWEKGREIHICIEDAGDGIPPGELSELFTRFSRGSTTKAGYGIGLAMARDIAVLHHGTLTAGNREERGAWFEFVLPVLEGAKAYANKTDIGD